MVEEGFDVLVNVLWDVDNYCEGGYICCFLNDFWDNLYQYVYFGENGVFDIYLFGVDGCEGGEDNDVDIGNWQG